MQHLGPWPPAPLWRCAGATTIDCIPVHDLAALRVVDKRSANDHPAVHHVSSIQARVVQIRYQEGVDDVDVRPAESILGSSSTRAIERGGIRSTTADRIKAVLPLTMVGRSIAKERICVVVLQF